MFTDKKIKDFWLKYSQLTLSKSIFCTLYFQRCLVKNCLKFSMTPESDDKPLYNVTLDLLQLVYFDLARNAANVMASCQNCRFLSEAGS